MKTPLNANQIAKLRKDQARRLYMALELARPELVELKSSMIHGEVERKPTKREREIQEVRTNARMQGYTEAQDRFKREMEDKEKSLAHRRKELHLETLKAVRDLASAYGQMMGEVARAMQSEKDQL